MPEVKALRLLNRASDPACEVSVIKFSLLEELVVVHHKLLQVVVVDFDSRLARHG